MKALIKIWLCVVFTFVYASSLPQSPRGPVSDNLLKLISEYVQSGLGGSSSSEGHGAGSNQAPLPILILPVPITQNSGRQAASSCIGPDCNKKEKNFKIFVQDPNLAEEVNNGFNNNNFNKAYLENKLNNQYRVLGDNRNKKPLNNEFYDQNSNVEYQLNNAGEVYNTKIKPPSKRYQQPTILITRQRINQSPIALYQTNGASDEQVPTPPLTNEFNNQESNVKYQTNNAEEAHKRKIAEHRNRQQTSDVPRERTNKKSPLRGSTNLPIPKLPNVKNSKELLKVFQDQYKHLQGQDLPPALIDISSYNIQTPSSDYLLALFHNQSAYHQHQELPPAVIDRAALDIEDPVDYDEEFSHIRKVGSGFKVQGPLTPQWDYSMNIKGQLHVPRADYSEPYEMWYDSNTRASRVDFHNGGTRTYRMVLPDGKMQRVAIRVNRLKEINIPECWVGPPEGHHKDHMIVPGLPDLRDYQFNGYEEAGDARAERWVRIVQGGPGELGAANGETLKYSHKILVARNNGKTVPVSYTVNVDSSLLGPNCDTYSYLYIESQEMDLNTDPDLFQFDPETECVVMELAEPHNPMHLVHLEPLREFTLQHRDPRYDIEFNDYKSKFHREYIDEVEEAIRKNVVIQNSRFVRSGNRQSATFELEMNFLGDRLDAEYRQLLGVDLRQYSDDKHLGDVSVEGFPHSASEIRKLSKKLPMEFDWRSRGAVSHVRDQKSCMSCWSMAITGAVEGALFIKRKVLVPLSNQNLVDCSIPYGTNGCTRGSWPRDAYAYIKDHGLAAAAEYGQYLGKVDTCRQVPPVTHISAYVNVTTEDSQALQVAIRRHGPTVVIIDAESKSVALYKAGVLYNERCGKTVDKLTHAVLAVGWGYHKGATHFILKNSYADHWGENGYLRVQGPANTCGVLTQPTYPVVKDKDVDRIPRQFN